MNKIDIIIPIYNSKDTLEKTLISIERQNILDKIEIYLIDDYSTDNYESILNRYNNLNIHYHKLDKNVGPGLARQKGIDISNNKYIFFLDSDDEIFLPDSLEKLYNEIEKGFDVVVSNTKYEKINEIYNNSGDLHGKLYLRDFIIKNDIKFNNTRYHEDNAFHNLVIVHGANTSFIKNITYLYSHNINSLTEIDKEKEFNNLEILISNTKYIIDIGLKHNCNEFIIRECLYRKVRYLNKRYEDFNNLQKEQIQVWLKKYKLNIGEYLNRKDYANIQQEILNNYDLKN